MTEQELRNALNEHMASYQFSAHRKRQIMAQINGEEPIVKKKISVSFALVLVIMLLTLSVGVAVVQSSIVRELYGSEETAPQDVVEHILMPQETAASTLGSLSVDEILYDGNALHVAFTVGNPTAETLLYTVDGIWLDGQPVDRQGRLTLEGAGSAGMLLGGEVDGVPMPASATLYNKGNFTYLADENGQYAGMAPLPEGKFTLKVAVAVWRPINVPKLVDYSQYEGVDVTETMSSLAVDKTGMSELWLFRPAQYNLGGSVFERPSEVYGEAYAALGWAKVVDTLEVEVEVDMNKAMIPLAETESSEYTQGGYRLVISNLTLSHAGGVLEGRIFGEHDEVISLMQNGLGFVDRAANRDLSRGLNWEMEPDEAGGYRFTMRLGPITGELPEQIDLAPVVALNPKWDETLPDYDPAVEKPEGVVGMYQYDFSRAFCIELSANK